MKLEDWNNERLKKASFHALKLFLGARSSLDKERYFTLYERLSRITWSKPISRKDLLSAYTERSERMTAKTLNRIKYEKLYPGKTNRKIKKDRY